MNPADSPALHQTVNPVNNRITSLPITYDANRNVTANTFYPLLGYDVENRVTNYANTDSGVYSSVIWTDNSVSVVGRELKQSERQGSGSPELLLPVYGEGTDALI